MATKEREQLILDELDRVGACTYEDLMRLLNVSSMTVRRAVDQLAKRGEVVKTLGGIQRASGVAGLYETTLMSRVMEQRPQKRAIAELALSLIESGQTVYLDGSTTCLELAKLIAREREGVTVVSNSVATCLELSKTTRNKVLCIGGECDASSMCCGGPQCEKWAQTYFVDKVFVSTKGFLVDEGTFESSVSTLRIKQVMAERTKEVVLLVDHSKFGQRALCKVIDVAQIGTVVTDDGTLARDQTRMKKAGMLVLVAPMGDGKMNEVTRVA
ncbi:MAG: DeoR/GlpR transcriptional regulator [Lentisphaerae bacterium]|nr:DeoR/GlpR transcriptional regulator [Lentisphaerota bacterium]